MTAAARLIRRELAEGRTAHAYAFLGPASRKKRACLDELVGAFLCRAKGPGGLACGACRDCRAREAGEHPDLLALRPDGRRIGLETARLGLAHLARRPHQAPVRVLVLEAADELTPEAANALLKLLEEPPPTARAVLEARAGGSLPATLLSRCRAVAFPAPPLDEAAAHLEALGVEAGLAREAAVLAEGDVERASAWLAEGEAWRTAREAAREAVLRGGATVVEEVALAESLARHAALGFPVAEWMMLAVRDGLARSLGGRALWLSAQEAEALARLSPERLLAMAKTLELVRRSLRQNVTPRLAFEAALIELGRARGGPARGGRLA
ncbi:MAG: hypothetical protein IRZ11_01675 [Clostridia bacterium]|nr:hypothetical protein [Clostridia bacterium]